MLSLSVGCGKDGVGIAPAPAPSEPTKCSSLFLPPMTCACRPQPERLTICGRIDHSARVIGSNNRPDHFYRKATMTNEELATLIQRGRSDLYVELWQQVRRFVVDMAFRRLRRVVRPSEVDVDDLIQSGFIALVDAVSAYDLKRGAFTTILGYYLRRAFNEACGTRTERAARDPIHKCLSLDDPLSDDDPEGETMIDLIPAPGDMEQDAVDNVYREQLRAAEERLLKRISVKGADIIRSTYLDGESLSSVAMRYNSTESRIRGLRDSFISTLRSMARATPEGRTLRNFVEGNTDYYRQVSVDQFNRTHTSAPEGLTLRREELAGIYKRWKKEIC